MIRINLLDQSPGKRNAVGDPSLPQGGGSVIVLLAAMVMITLNGGLAMKAWKNVGRAKADFQGIKAERDGLKANINSQLNEADQIREFREIVANQMDVLRSLDPQDRILWCEKVNMLANLIPANVFLVDLEITEDVKMVETEQSKIAREKWKTTSKKKRKGDEPKPVFKPVIKYKMDITGLALGKDSVEQFNNVLSFHEAMIAHQEVDAFGKDQRFMDGFNSNIEFDTVETMVYEGTPVNKFIFKLQTHEMGKIADNQEKPGEKKDVNVAASR
jgi:hypothetical protein